MENRVSTIVYKCTAWAVCVTMPATWAATATLIASGGDNQTKLKKSRRLNHTGIITIYIDMETSILYACVTMHMHLLHIRFLVSNSTRVCWWYNIAASISLIPMSWLRDTAELFYLKCFCEISWMQNCVNKSPFCMVTEG